jgi:hypothetical protein
VQKTTSQGYAWMAFTLSFLPCSVQKTTSQGYAWMAEEITPLNLCSDLSGQLKKQPLIFNLLYFIIKRVLTQLI